MPNIGFQQAVLGLAVSVKTNAGVVVIELQLGKLDTTLLHRYWSTFEIDRQRRHSVFSERALGGLTLPATRVREKPGGGAMLPAPDKTEPHVNA